MYVRVNRIGVMASGWDRRGRRRQPGQERGLRPLYPELPPSWLSRVIRVAMPAERWTVLDHLVAAVRPDAGTGARAAGQVLMHLMDGAGHAAPRAAWLDFERDKGLRLLRASRAA
jgi:hypothetical protein